MTTAPSAFSAVGVTIGVFEPLVIGGTFRETLTNESASLSTEKTAYDGYRALSFTVTGPVDLITAWVENGLGRHIELYNQGGETIFECFVNLVSANVGGVSVERGPLIDIANRVRAIYTPIDYLIWPPVVGSETTTILVDDAISQSFYGIIEKAIGAGRVPDATAEQVRDVYLKENKTPKISSTISVAPGSSQVGTALIDCVGYYEWLGFYPYQSVVAGYVTASAKIISLIAAAADPNDMFSADVSNIVASALLVGDADYGDRTALDVVREIITLGNDTTDDRRLFMVGNGRKVYYQRIPTQVDYTYAIGDVSQAIRDRGGSIVYPWDVQPGKFIEVTDFLPGLLTTTTDPLSAHNVLFIESVKFTAPWTVDLSGGKTDTLSQLLAKITYTGGLIQ